MASDIQSKQGMEVRRMKTLKKRMNKRTLVSLSSPCGSPDLCIQKCNYSVPALDGGVMEVIDSHVSA